MPVELICKKCKSKFYRPPSHAGRLYCSMKCRGNSRGPIPMNERLWPKITKTDSCWIAKPAANGYPYIWCEKEKRRLKMARVVWILTNGPIPDGMMILHNCHNTLCVKPEHLYMGTRSDNTNDAVRIGTHFTPFRKRSDYGMSKLTRYQVSTIREMDNLGISQTRLSKEFGVCISTISCIVNRKTWRHLP